MQLWAKSAIPGWTGSQITRIATTRFILALFLAAGVSSNSKLYGQAGLARTGKGRQTIKAKLASIRLDTFKVENLPLSEVIKNLSDEARRRDPQKRGVNFLLNPNGEVASTANNQPAVTPPAEPVDIAGLQIKIAPMIDVSLEDALNAVVRMAGPPRLKYVIEDYAVVLYPSAEAMTLSVRVFKVDPNTFQQGLHSVAGVPFANISVSAGNGGGGVGGGQGGQNGSPVTVPRVQIAPPQGGIPGVSRTNGMETVQASVRSFLQRLGVDMTPPKSAFFNDRQGTLIVRATPADLELIATALGH
jgi:hypothetical protein